MKHRSNVFLLLATLFMFALPGQAQTAQPAGAVLAGVVEDVHGAVVAGATVRVRRVNAGADERTAMTDGAGHYRFEHLPLGTYTVTAEAQGFAPGATMVDVAGATLTANLALGVTTLAEVVNVTAARGATATDLTTPESISVIGEREIAERRANILPQLLVGEPGVAVQQTTPSQGSPYVRGFTGQQVVNLIDGVRYNNATFRRGPNQYTALIEPVTVGRIEIVRGPTSAQYGSDALGGTVNILTAQPAPFADRRAWHGGFDLFGGSADLSTGAALFATTATKRTSLVFGGAARQAQDLRAGRGGDSRAAVFRFLGLDPQVLGSRLQDTSFQQYSGFGKFLWTPSTKSLVSLNFQHGRQNNVRRYDQMNGGNGNLINAFPPQVLNFFYARYEREQTGPFNTLQATFSINSQRDDRRFQGGFGNPRATITDEYNRTNAYGYSVQGTLHAPGRQSLTIGAEVYDEYVAARRTELDPVTGATAQVRARYPDGARYTTYGAFVQDAVELIPQRLRVTGGLRYSLFDYKQSARKNPFALNGVPAVTDERTKFDDVSFNAGVVVQATHWLAFNALVSRGFRAPNVTDFGSIGLTSLGLEVTPQAAQAAGASFKPLGPETAYNYEGGFKLKTSRFDGSVKFFDAEINGLIELEPLALPPGAVGRSVGGQLITRQNEAGVVFTNLSTRPVQVRFNTEPVRLRGFETALRGRLTRDLQLNANTAYVRNDIKGTHEPANFEGFAPPWLSYVALRWEPLGRRFFVEPYLTAAARQARYSEEDFEEQRSGAERNREDIADFFNNGAVARGLVRPGTDGLLHLVTTGETLAQVQQRVLPLGATINGVTVVDDETEVPLYTKTAGFATLNVRVGYRIGERHTLTFGVENIFDRNYRINGSGTDSPGVNATMRYQFRF